MSQPRLDPRLGEETLRIRHLDVHLTHRCNLRCTYCYAADPGAKLPPDITPERADAAVDFLFCHGIGKRLRIDLWGGEPLLRLDLIQRIAERGQRLAHIHGRSLRISVPTNVTLIDDRALALVKTWDLSLSLSLDGKPEAHAQRRTRDGRNGWTIIEPRLDRLLERWEGPLPPVRMTVVPERADRLEEDLAFLIGLGFRQIAFLPASGARWSQESTDLLDASFRAVALDWAARVRAGRDVPYYPHLLRRIVPHWMGSLGRILPLRRGLCGAGETLIAVDTLGDLYPCHRVVGMPRPPMDLRLGSLEQGLTHGGLVRRIAALRADAAGVRCAECEHRSCCGTLCIALNHRVTGDIARVPDEACFVMERLRRAAHHFHGLVEGLPAYDAMMERYVSLDPDDRFLPLLSALEEELETEALLEEVERLLTGKG